ncbi:hypothetical protein LSH36_474g02021 [Paralvinella palmiformis]|uniref:SAM-dependent MTase RsmB/NOP-type domain-containing protein n=1 Tax=Paralvinella palmiformis TaxID=53620 RepID=A0AAD9J966_9ANNE|nr:hypothetical protein LSH36_474g02021 [Paralvinella palmiformis]
MLEDCKFFSQYPEFKDDHALVMVILCDFKQRKFQKRLPLSEDEINPYICQIEDALYDTRTKLNAALARSRIKARVLSIDHLLPDSVRKNEKIGSNMHIPGWINLIKTSMETVLNQLRDEDFVEVQSDTKLSGKSYMLDNQCTDMIIFSYDQRDNIEQHMLVQDGHLVLQDKSSCVGPHSVRALINEGDDILHINPGSGVSTAHLASLTHNSDTVIYTIGIHSEKQLQQVTNNLERLGAKSRVKVIQDNLSDIEYQDERLKHIKVVLLTAECSRSGVANPVNFIVSEGEDMSILRDLSLGYTDDGKLGELVVKHNTTLKHALRFPRVQAVVYCTRSILDPENENVVTRSLEYVNMVQQKKTPYRIAPPVIPLSDRDIEMENPLNGKYLRYPPSNLMSGCFIATITREADDPKEAAKDILAKAAARGIISGVDVKREEKPQKAKSKSGHKRNKAPSRRRSPPRSGLSRESTLPTKGSSPSAARRTVSRKFYSSSKLSNGTRSHSNASSGMIRATHMHTKVFHSPFGDGDGLLTRRAAPSASSAPSWSRPSQRAPIPPHEKVVKHPMPFR